MVGGISKIGRRLATELRSKQGSNDLVLLLRNCYFIPKKLLRDALKREASRYRGRTLVDIGCGWKPYRPFLDHLERYVGIDITAQRAADIVASADRIPLSDGVADAVLCTEVIEHMRDPAALCRELARVARPNTTLLITAPMSWNLHYEPHDYYRFTPYGLAHLLEEAGFEVLAKTRIGGLGSLIGARLVDVLHLKLLHMPLLRRMPRRHALVALALAPLNALLFPLGRALDSVDRTDAIGWLLVARRTAIDASGRPQPTVRPCACDETRGTGEVAAATA